MAFEEDDGGGAFTPTTSPHQEVVDHLATVWGVAEAALKKVGQKPSPANMHVMFEEAGKLLRDQAPTQGGRR